MYQKLQKTSKAIHRGKYLTLKILTKINMKEKKTYELGIWLKKLRNEQQNKLKEDRRN